MSQQTWVGSDLVSEVLLNDIPDNDTELYTRVGLLEDELYAARDGEATLLAKEDDQDTLTAIVTAEVEAARSGKVSLLAKETDQDTLTAIVTAEVVAARDGKASLLAKELDQDTKIATIAVISTTGFPSQSGNAGAWLSTDGSLPYWLDPTEAVQPILKKYFSL